jgi:MFS family permease
MSESYSPEPGQTKNATLPRGSAPVTTWPDPRRALAAGDPRRVLALMTACFGLGQIIGPTFAGALSDRLGNFTVPSVVAALALLLAAALVRPMAGAAGASHPTQPCDSTIPASVPRH